MVALNKNSLISSLMNLLFGSPRSAHVLFSEKARQLFKNRQTGDKIISEISKNKKIIAEGGKITIDIKGDPKVHQVEIEGVSEELTEK